MKTTPAAIAVLLLISGCTEKGIGAAPGVSADQIRSINVGMTRAEVESILGAPEDGRVHSVHAKRYARWGFDDELGLYGRRPESDWEAPEFARMFPNSSPPISN